MSVRTIAALALVGGVIALGAAVGLAAGQAGIGWDVLSGGGGSGAGGRVAIADSIGQPVVGGSDGGDVHLEAGFWAGVGSGDLGPTPTGTRPTATATATRTATFTPGPSPTGTATTTRTATFTPGPSPTGTATATRTATFTPGPSPTPTVTRTPGGRTLSLPLVLKAHSGARPAALPPWSEGGR